jgi:hypothetical protein
MPVLESAIERQFVKEARALGCRTRKLNGAGHVGWPDQLVLVPGGVTLLIEFKRPKEKLRPTQVIWHNEAKSIGHNPHVFDNWQSAIALVKVSMK